MSSVYGRYSAAVENATGRFDRVAFLTALGDRDRSTDESRAVDTSQIDILGDAYSDHLTGSGRTNIKTDD